MKEDTLQRIQISILLKKTSDLIISLLLVVILCSCGEDRTFEQQWNEGINEAYVLLGGQGYCPHQCADKSSLHFSPFQGGFGIEIYGITDPKVLGQVVEIFVRKFNETQLMRRLVIHAYAFSKHEDEKQPFIKKWKEGSILDVEMQRTNL